MEDQTVRVIRKQALPSQEYFFQEVQHMISTMPYNTLEAAKKFIVVELKKIKQLDLEWSVMVYWSHSSTTVEISQKISFFFQAERIDKDVVVCVFAHSRKAEIDKSTAQTQNKSLNKDKRELKQELEELKDKLNKQLEENNKLLQDIKEL